MPRERAHRQQSAPARPGLSIPVFLLNVPFHYCEKDPADAVIGHVDMSRPMPSPFQ